MKIIVTGAGGRMGQAVLTEVFAHQALSLHGLTDQSSSPLLGQDAATLVGRSACGVTVTDDILPLALKGEGIIDFTLPAALARHAEVAAQARIPLVVGTTGISETDKALLQAASAHTPIVYSGNMSLGVNLLSALVQRAAAALDETFDIEILEMHHKHKIDTPSGTALLLGEAAASGRGVTLGDKAIYAREGVTGPRPDGAIGFATLRGGSVIGDHEVIFAGQGERITLKHESNDRGLYARGAIKALLWAQKQKPGLYNILDVLALQMV